MTTAERLPATERRSAGSFLEAIGRLDLKERLTPQTPWADYSMEVYLQKFGLKGGGGLGILKGDTVLEARRLGLPHVVFSLFYPERLAQVLDDNFYPQDQTEKVTPEEQNYHKLEAKIKIRSNGDEAELALYQVPNLPLYLLSEPGLQYQYPGDNNTDHRLYQAVVLGFGGYQAEETLGLKPALTQINEGASICRTLAQLDSLCQKGQSFEDAKNLIRKTTIFTNHSLASAANPKFSLDQFERYVLKNIKTEILKQWLRGLILSHDGKVNLTTLALELAGKSNGVSQIHAQSCRRLLGAEFQPITNGISLERWVHPKLLQLYREAGILDEYDLPGVDYQKRIADLDPKELRRLKNLAKDELRVYLRNRQDQYGNQIDIPPETKIISWAKRLAAYKRPEMLFANPQRLADILKKNKAHVLFSGKAHPNDNQMKQTLQKILHTLDQNPTLKERVHFIQDYDEDFAGYLVAGADIGLNTPRVNTEADGTSWKKLIAGLARLISTPDGGVADLEPPACLIIKGKIYRKEVDSLYTHLESALGEIENTGQWTEEVKKQLSGYLPIISGPRMIKGYLNFGLPWEERRASEGK